MTVRACRTVFKGRIITVSVEAVDLPNGSHLEMEIIRHPGGAAVVAINASDHVCLLYQYRHAAGGWLWELPAGKIEHGEPPLRTARHELEEEAGVRAENWRELGEVVSSPGVFNERVHLFLATGLSGATRRAEEHEVFERHWVPYKEALAWARQGKIQDAKSVAALFRAQPHIKA